MKNIEKAFRFLFKNWVIAVPAVIGNGLVGIALVIFWFYGFMSVYSELLKNLRQNSVIDFSSLIPFYTMAGVIVILSVILAFLYIPVIAGLVHESMRKNKLISFNNLFAESIQAFKNNIKKYAKFFFTNILFIFIFYLIFTGIFTAVMLAIPAGIGGASAVPIVLLFMFIIMIVIFALILVYYAFTSMWLQSMVVDDYGVFKAFNVCWNILKRRFWYLMGMCVMSILISLGISLVTAIFGIIPILGQILTYSASGISTVYIFVFYMYIYYENRPEPELNGQFEIDEGIQY